MANNITTGVYEYKGEEKTFKFYTGISAGKKVKFISSVVDTIVGDRYYSILRDIIFDFEIIDIFTDIDVSEIKNIEEPIFMIDKIEDFLNETNIVKIVKENFEPGIIDELNTAVDDDIAFRTGVCKNDLLHSLAKIVNTTTKMISGIDTNAIMQMAGKINEIQGEITPDSIINAFSEAGLLKNNVDDLLENTKNDGV